ncbi:hypothetical protein KKG81_01325 [bacterium]|nr:hypothetical protein [bacterium]
MKKLTIIVLVAGLFAGSLFASENNSMMGMDKEKCMAMYKSMHQDVKKNSSSKLEQHQNILNPDRSESQLYEG